MSAGVAVRAETSRARDGSRPGAMAGPPPPVSARTGAPARRFLIDQRDLWSVRRAAKRWLVQVLTSCCEGRAE